MRAVRRNDKEAVFQMLQYLNQIIAQAEHHLPTPVWTLHLIRRMPVKIKNQVNTQLTSSLVTWTEKLFLLHQHLKYQRNQFQVVRRYAMAVKHPPFWVVVIVRQTAFLMQDKTR